MKKIIAASVVALALGLPTAGSAAQFDSCVAANGGSCTIVAGSEADDITVEGTTLLGARGSWIAGGSWTIEMFLSGDCSGTPFRTYSSADDNNLEGLGGANNGGGYYGTCVKATAGEDGFVLLGSTHSGLLP